MSIRAPVLDVCCGSRMFWFDRSDTRALFLDKRRETHTVDTRDGRRQIVVAPDFLGSFTALPFPDDSFPLVVFDPPHTFSGEKGWMCKKYGSLTGDWRADIRAGFAECFRVLAPQGTLIFKWNEHRVPVATVLSLTPEKPLFGQRCGASAKTHWIVFMKPGPYVTAMEHGPSLATHEQELECA
ncbi:MAG: class I SAM-dependent methyltransferase [Pseudomonadota bacterium]